MLQKNIKIFFKIKSMKHLTWISKSLEKGVADEDM